MNANKVNTLRKMVAVLFLLLSNTLNSFARFGGAGGHYGGGHSYGGGHYGGGGFGGGGSTLFYIVIIIVAVVVRYYFNQNNGNVAATETRESLPATIPFPEGLDPKKVAASFFAMQDAWQRKDLKNVRKWLSDGMYQRISSQIKMMDALGQSNILSNIRINDIAAVDTAIDGHYQIAQVAISFTMNDRFISNTHPEFNEDYEEDSDTEYWTFIKRTDSIGEKNLYDNNNCPNCGAPFEVKMGEISRCSNCNTLTNSAAYDWVLNEITQSGDYNDQPLLSQNAALKKMMSNDPFFAVERMEDIASNIFMQIMDVMAGEDKRRLTRFADEQTTVSILQEKQKMPPFVFDRLYLNNVTLSSYVLQGDTVKLYYDINATYRRVATGNKLQLMDRDFITHHFSMELSRNKNILSKASVVETVYSYECSSCAAPYTDTTEDHCSYCDAPVIDTGRNWVLTNFAWN